MSARKDHDKLLKDLRREKWDVSERGNIATATHPRGGQVDIPCHAQGIHNAKIRIRQIEQQHEEANRLRIRALNVADKVDKKKLAQVMADNVIGPGIKPKRSEAPMNMTPKNDDPKEKDDAGAMLELLAEQSNKIGALGLQLASIGRKIDQFLSRLQEDADRKADEQAFAKRLQLLDEELKDLPVDGVKVITFETEAEQVAHTRVLHAYGRNHDKDFRPTKEGLKTSVWRVK